MRRQRPAKPGREFYVQPEELTSVKTHVDTDFDGREDGNDHCKHEDARFERRNLPE